MRTLERNKKRFWYCPRIGTEEIYDEYGNATGEYREIYGEPVETRGNISPAAGRVRWDVFGGLKEYDKNIVVSAKCPIDEFSVLFVDKEPEFDSEGFPLYDYYVSGIAVSQTQDSKTVAISRATVS